MERGDAPASGDERAAIVEALASLLLDDLELEDARRVVARNESRRVFAEAR